MVTSTLQAALALLACGTLGYFGSRALAPREAEQLPVEPRVAVQLEIARLIDLEQRQAADMQHLYDAMIADGLEGQLSFSLHLSRWAELDPHGAVDLFEDQFDSGLAPVRIQAHDAITELLVEWSLLDRDAALEAVAELDDKWLRKQMLDEILWESAGRAPEKYFEETPRSEKDGAREWDDHGRAIAALATEDPAAARRLLEQLPPEARDMNSEEFAEVWAVREPSAAFKWARSIAPEEGGYAVDHVLGQWERSDPAAAETARQLLVADGLFEDYPARPVVWKLARKDPIAALSLALDRFQATENGMDPELQELARRVLLECGDEAKPVLRRYFSSLGFDTRSTFRFVRSIPRNQIGAVIKQLRSFEDQSKLGGFQRDLLKHWMRSDSAAATAYVEEFPEGGADRHFWAVAALQAPNLESAIGIIEAKVSVKHRSSMIGHLFEGSRFGRIFTLDEALAAFGRFSDQELRSCVAPVIARRWTAADPHAAVAWALKLENPELRLKALGAISYKWDESLFGEEAKWVLENVPIGADQHALLEALNIDLQTATAWAASLTDEAQREAKLLKYLDRWYRRSPSEALAATRRIEIPAPLKRHLLQNLSTINRTKK